jgi:hypothetical protein
MSVRHLALATRAFAILAIATLALAPLPRVAFAEPPLLIDDGPSTVQPEASQALCTLEPAPLGTIFTVFTGETWTAHYTLLQTSTCTACPVPTTLELKTVTFRVRWASPACPSTGFTAELSIVRAIPDPFGSGCLVPDPNAVLCGPIQHVLPAQAAPQIVTLPLPSGCCVAGPAFLSVRYLNVTGNCVPITNVSGPCVACAQYFTTNLTWPTITHTCSVLSTMQWFAVDADCCQPTERAPGSWGRLKTLYR